MHNQLFCCLLVQDIIHEPIAHCFNNPAMLRPRQLLHYFGLSWRKWGRALADASAADEHLRFQTSLLLAHLGLHVVDRVLNSDVRVKPKYHVFAGFLFASKSPVRDGMHVGRLDLERRLL